MRAVRLTLLLALLVAPSVGVAVGATAGSKTVADRRGDTKAADLDVLSARVTAAGSLVRMELTLAASVRDNAIYSGWIDCSGKSWQLAAKKAAGTRTFFLFSWDTYTQVRASGFASGRTVTVTGPAAKMGCTRGTVRFYVTAEGTNGRAQMTDRVPARGQATFPA